MKETHSEEEHKNPFILRNLTRDEYRATHQALVEQFGDLKSRFEQFEASTRGGMSAVEQSKINYNRILMAIIAVSSIIIAGGLTVLSVLIR